MDGGGRAPARHRQGREAPGGGEPRARSSTRSTESWSPAATSAWSCRCGTSRWCRSERSAARLKAKPVIVATQMLDSMIDDPRPTRAEASDVANAVLDGADAVMLSGETSVGRHPLAALATMAASRRPSRRTPSPRWRPRWPAADQGGAIARAAAEVGEAVGAKFLVAFTQSGDTARRLARHRSPIPVLAFTPERAVRNQLALTWGVETFLVARGRPHRSRWCVRWTRPCWRWGAATRATRW